MRIPPPEDDRSIVEPRDRADRPVAADDGSVPTNGPIVATNGPVMTNGSLVAPADGTTEAAPDSHALSAETSSSDTSSDAEPIRTTSAFAELAQAETPAPAELATGFTATPSTPLAESTPASPATVTSVLPPDQTPPPPPPIEPTSMDGGFPSPDEEEEGMTMLEHLEELRVRVIIACVALALGLAFAAVPTPWTDSLTKTVINVVNKPAEGYLQAIQPGEIFITYVKVALLVGAALAMPVMIYQLMKFVLPALHQHEKKYLFMAMPGATLSFIIGIVFGYVLLLPFAINFLLNFGAADFGVEVKWSFGEYVGTVTSLLFWMGLAFETPLLMFFLTKLRVLSVERLVRVRKYAFILAFIAGAIITPTPDPLNQTIISVPLYLLFELGILLARLA